VRRLAPLHDHVGDLAGRGRPAVDGADDQVVRAPLLNGRAAANSEPLSVRMPNGYGARCLATKRNSPSKVIFCTGCGVASSMLNPDAAVRRSERIGGLLNYYHREAA